MEAYIKGTAAISPQHTFNTADFLNQIVSYRGLQAKCIEPEYKAFINPMTMRRMSRIVRMGVVASFVALKDAGVEIPDAIITGTGLGCIEDTESFLCNLIQKEEKLLNPTPFIQSTHNTVGAQVALLIKCHNYNFTYVHRGFSFESALLDSMMQIAENPQAAVLTGGIDEMTPNTFTITKRLGMWKKENVLSTDLLKHKTAGSISGEGATFFVLSGKEHPGNYAKIRDIKTVYMPGGVSNIEAAIAAFLEKNNLSAKDIDHVIYGFSGDHATDTIYYRLAETIFASATGLYYKHLCGEYSTASAFAVWLGAKILKHQMVPEAIKLPGATVNPVKNILIYNHYLNINHSLVLLSSC